MNLAPEDPSKLIASSLEIILGAVADGIIETDHYYTYFNRDTGFLVHLYPSCDPEKMFLYVENSSDSVPQPAAPREFLVKF